MTRRNVLVTGAFGQIGSELGVALRERDNCDLVIASAKTVPAVGTHPLADQAVQLDVLERSELQHVVEKYQIGVIYHLAARLSAVGETAPQEAWSVNMNGLINVLEVARSDNAVQVFWPSSIAVFGPDTPKHQTPQDTIMRPATMYGVSKVAGELLADYYVRKFGVDVRGVRYPGIISSGAPPGGGTTDYAVEIFHAAIRDQRYEAFVSEDCVLPMMYMPDAIKAALDLMAAPRERLLHHNGFNVSAMSFALGDLVAEIRNHIPEFRCSFAPDEREAIARTWPRSIDDSVARHEWGWQPDYDLSATTRDMLCVLGRSQNRMQA